MPIEATPEDLELDRLAARAAGIHLHHWNENLQRWMTSSVEGGDPDGSWNARDDDGDALRLAAKLRIPVWFEEAAVVADQRKCGDLGWRIEIGVSDLGGYCATRRAIVRAAADIGRRMP